MSSVLVGVIFIFCFSSCKYIIFWFWSLWFCFSLYKIDWYWIWFL